MYQSPINFNNNNNNNNGNDLSTIQQNINQNILNQNLIQPQQQQVDNNQYYNGFNLNFDNSNNLINNNNNGVQIQQVQPINVQQLQQQQQQQQQIQQVQQPQHQQIQQVQQQQQQQQQGSFQTQIITVPVIKKRAKRACLNCRSSKVACDHQRPCVRCVKNGIEDSCRDVPRKPKVPTKRLKKDHSLVPVLPQLITDLGTLIPTHTFDGYHTAVANNLTFTAPYQPQILTATAAQPQKRFVTKQTNYGNSDFNLGIIGNNNTNNNNNNNSNNNNNNNSQLVNNNNSQSYYYAINNNNEIDNNVVGAAATSNSNNTTTTTTTTTTTSSNINDNKSKLDEDGISIVASPISSPSSPSSASSTPVTNFSESSSISSPNSPGHLALDPQQETITTVANNTAATAIANNVIGSNVQSSLESVFNNLSTLINSSNSSIQDPITVAPSPYGCCVKSPFAIDGNPVVDNEQSLKQSINHNNHNSNQNNNNHHHHHHHNQEKLEIVKCCQQPQQQHLPEVLINEFKKIHQSLERISTFLQFPTNTIQRPLYSPAPRYLLVPSSVWAPNQEIESKIHYLLKKFNLPYAHFSFPTKDLLEINDEFCKLIGYESVENLYQESPLLIWDDIVHKQIIPFTNRYALEAIVKKIHTFQKPCVLKKRNGKYFSVHLFIEFVQDFSSFKIYILRNLSPELDQSLSGEYIIREFNYKNCCLQLDDII